MSKELKQAKAEFQVMYDNISKDLSGILQRIWEDKVKAASKSMAEL